MKIQQLRLANFKLFENAQIDFKPLTLLTGTNSSGKTTILNALTALLQSQGTVPFPFELVPNGSACALGSFKEIVRGRNPRATFGIGVTLSDDDKLTVMEGRFRYSSSGNHILPSKIHFAKGGDVFDLEWLGQKLGYRISVDASGYNKDLNSPAMVGLKEMLASLAKARDDGESRSSKEKQKKRDFSPIFKEYREKSFNITARNAYEIIAKLRGSNFFGAHIVAEVKKTLDLLTRHLSYIAPVRAFPSRYYLPMGHGQEPDSSGNNAIARLYEWKKHFPVKYKSITKALQNLELATKFDTKSSLDEIVRMDVQPFGHSESVNYADVGFGISQVLPMLIADEALPKGGTLLVNQPEVHLHPSSQALLANYFVSKLSNRNYIAETHSEYLINRLRLLVVEGGVKPEDIQIIYVEGAKTSKTLNPRIYSIGIGKDGSLLNAPKTFFQTYYLDTFEIAMGGGTSDE